MGILHKNKQLPLHSNNGSLFKKRGFMFAAVYLKNGHIQCIFYFPI